MSRSIYFSNQFATIPGRTSQLGGNFWKDLGKGALNVLGTVAPVALEVGKTAAIHHLTKGRGVHPSIKQQGGSFGNHALQSGDIPSTSHARDLRGSGARKVGCKDGYIYRR